MSRTAEITVDLPNEQGAIVPVAATARETESGFVWESVEPTLASILISYTLHTFPHQPGYLPDTFAGLVTGAAALFESAGRVTKAPAPLDLSALPAGTIF